MKKYFGYLFTLFLSASLFVQCSNVANAQLFNPPLYLTNGTISGTTTLAGTLNFNNNAVFVSGTGVNLTAGTISPTTTSTTTVFKIFNQFAYGTWTPSYIGTVSSPSAITYSAQSGDFWKVMSYVCWIVDIAASSVTGGGGSVYVSGTPYVVTGSTGRGGGVVVTKSNWITNGPDVFLGVQGTHALQLAFDGNTVMTAITWANGAAAMNSYGYGCYKTTE